jgi:protease I
MSSDLRQRSFAVLVANEGVEQVELTEPWKAIEAAGGRPVLIAPEQGGVQAFNHLDKADTFEATQAVGDIDITDFDGLVLPGGVANPDQLRMDAAAVDVVRRFVESGRPVAAICHAPWTLIEANAVQGRRLTSWPSLQTDLHNAGADWVDETVVVCTEGPGPLITSRNPDDLPAFTARLVEVFAEHADTR